MSLFRSLCRRHLNDTLHGYNHHLVVDFGRFMASNIDAHINLRVRVYKYLPHSIHALDIQRLEKQRQIRCNCRFSSPSFYPASHVQRLKMFLGRASEHRFIVVAFSLVSSSCAFCRTFFVSHHTLNAMVNYSVKLKQPQNFVHKEKLSKNTRR